MFFLTWLKHSLFNEKNISDRQFYSLIHYQSKKSIITTVHLIINTKIQKGGSIRSFLWLEIQTNYQQLAYIPSNNIVIKNINLPNFQCFYFTHSLHSSIFIFPSCYIFYSSFSTLKKNTFVIATIIILQTGFLFVESFLYVTIYVLFK